RSGTSSRQSTPARTPGSTSSRAPRSGACASAGRRRRPRGPRARNMGLAARAAAAEVNETEVGLDERLELRGGRRRAELDERAADQAEVDRADDVPVAARELEERARAHAYPPLAGGRLQLGLEADLGEQRHEPLDRLVVRHGRVRRRRVDEVVAPDLPDL